MQHSTAAKKPLVVSDVLVRGSDMLKAQAEFRLVGRDQELIELSAILMKMKKRNLIVTGRGGVGISSIVLGLQASKRDYQTPVNIVGKRFFWFCTDSLFESGIHQVINELFEKVRHTLTRTQNSVVVIEDADDFIKAAQNSGCTHLINGLMGDLKSGKFQAILESKDENLGELLKSDGDILEFCTLYEVEEPGADNLRLILRESVKPLECHHGIGVSPAALEAAASLTEKYKLSELRAQPDAAVSLLDLALTEYSLQAHRSPPHIEALQATLKAATAAIGGGPRRSDLKDLASDAIRRLCEETTTSLKKAEQQWETLQATVRALYRDISDGEEEIRRLEDEIERQRAAQLERAEAASMQSTTSPSGERPIGALSSIISSGTLDTPEVAARRSQISKLETLVSASTDRYKEKVAELYAGLRLEESHVLKSFSALSGIPVERLNEDERVKLRQLDQLLATRVIGQEEPTTEVAKAVKRARLGLKMTNKPAGTFMFLGPSGVGKTELAKALAEALGVPLLRFDMSEYMEKHAVSKLIGAPPGYEGFEHGGILTNAVRRNPYSVVLFDEIEKAHVDVFNVMLQLLDDARLTDSRGLTASFRETTIIMTTNIGTLHFLDETMPFCEAKELALADLRQQYRPEFLGRFGGNIYCFQRLTAPVLQTIARKDLTRINGLITAQGIRLDMADEDLSAMIAGKYIAREGARSVLGYIDRHITSGIADVVLSESDARGTIVVRYDPEKQNVSLLLSSPG